MKVTLYMAISLNGYVAEKDGSEGFLSHAHWEKFCRLAREYGNFIAGRKTYEAVKNWNASFGFDDLKEIQKIIISRDENYRLDEGYALARSPQDALSKLKNSKSILVAGGPTINTAFIKEKLLDEIILNLEPALIGQGIPLFAPGNFSQKLELISSEQSDDIVTLRYKVIK